MLVRAIRIEKPNDEIDAHKIPMLTQYEVMRPRWIDQAEGDWSVLVVLEIDDREKCLFFLKPTYAVGGQAIVFKSVKEVARYLHFKQQRCSSQAMAAELSTIISDLDFEAIMTCLKDKIAFPVEFFSFQAYFPLGLLERPEQVVSLKREDDPSQQIPEQVTSVKTEDTTSDESSNHIDDPYISFDIDSSNSSDDEGQVDDGGSDEEQLDDAGSDFSMPIASSTEETDCERDPNWVPGSGTDSSSSYF
jgi:hypothetical protein